MNHSRALALSVLVVSVFGLVSADQTPKTWESWSSEFQKLYREVLRVDERHKSAFKSGRDAADDIQAVLHKEQNFTPAQRLVELKRLAEEGNPYAWANFRDESFAQIRETMQSIADDKSVPPLERAERIASLLRGATANTDNSIESFQAKSRDGTVRHLFLDSGNELIADLFDEAAFKGQAEVKNVQAEIARLRAEQSKARTAMDTAKVEQIETDMAAQQERLRGLIGTEAGQPEAGRGVFGSIDFRLGNLAWYLDHLTETEQRLDGPFGQPGRLSSLIFEGGDQSQLAAKAFVAEDPTTGDAMTDMFMAMAKGDDVRTTKVADALRQRMLGDQLDAMAKDGSPEGEEISRAVSLQHAIRQLAGVRDGSVDPVKEKLQILEFMKRYPGDPQGEELLGLTYAGLVDKMSGPSSTLKSGAIERALMTLEPEMTKAKHLPVNDILNSLRGPMAGVRTAHLIKERDCKGLPAEEELVCRRAESAKRAAIRLGVVDAKFNCDGKTGQAKADCQKAAEEYAAKSGVFRELPSYGGVEDFLGSRYTCSAFQKARADEQTIFLGPVRGVCQAQPESYKGSLEDTRRYLATGIPETTGVEGQAVEMLKSAREIFSARDTASRVKMEVMQEEYLEGIRHTFMTLQAEQLATLTLLQDGGEFDATEVKNLCALGDSSSATSRQRAIARDQARFRSDVDKIQANLYMSQMTGALPGGVANVTGVDASVFREIQAVDLILAAFSMEVLEQEREIRNSGRGPERAYSQEMIEAARRHPFLTLGKSGEPLYRRMAKAVDAALGVGRTTWAYKDGRDRANTFQTSNGSPHPFLISSAKNGVDDSETVQDRLKSLLRNPNVGPSLMAIVQSAIGEGVTAAKENIKNACRAPLLASAKGDAPFSIEEIRDPAVQTRFFDTVENRMYLEHECSLRENKTILTLAGSEKAANIAIPVMHILLWASGNGATSIAWSIGEKGSKYWDEKSELEAVKRRMANTGSGDLESVNTEMKEAQDAAADLQSTVAIEAVGFGVGFKGNIRQLAPFLRNYGMVPGMVEGGARVLSEAEKKGAEALRRRAMKTTVDRATGAVRIPIYSTEKGAGVAIRVIGEKAEIAIDHAFFQDSKAVNDFMKRVDQMIDATKRIGSRAKARRMVKNIEKMRDLVGKRRSLWERFATRLKGGRGPAQDKTFVPKFGKEAFSKMSDEARTAATNIFTKIDDAATDAFLKKYQDEVMNVIQAIDTPGATMPDGLITRLANEIRASATLAGATGRSLDDLGKALGRIVTECAAAAK